MNYNKKEVDINTFYRNNKDDIIMLYKTIKYKMNELNLTKFSKKIDFNDFVNFIYNKSDKYKYNYYN